MQRSEDSGYVAPVMSLLAHWVRANSGITFTVFPSRVVQVFRQIPNGVLVLVEGHLVLLLLVKASLSQHRLLDVTHT
jgi:hypothetical protein